MEQTDCHQLLTIDVNVSGSDSSSKNSGNISPNFDSGDEGPLSLKKTAKFPFHKDMLSKYTEFTATGFSGLSPKKAQKPI